MSPILCGGFFVPLVHGLRSVGGVPRSIAEGKQGQKMARPVEVMQSVKFTSHVDPERVACLADRLLSST